MGRRGDHSFKEISQMILDAASQLVEEEGYQKLSTRKIANKIGYTVGTLYNAYENLDDIIMHLNRKTIDALIASLKKSIAKETDVVKKFKKLALAYAKFSRKNFHKWDMLVNHSFSEKTEVPKWYKQKVQDIFNLLIAEFDDKGANKYDTHDIITVMWASVHGICILSIKNKFNHINAKQRTDSLIENFIDNYFNGLEI